MLEAAYTFAPLPSLHKWDALLLLTSSNERTNERNYSHLLQDSSSCFHLNLNERRKEREQFLFEIIKRKKEGKKEHPSNFRKLEVQL